MCIHAMVHFSYEVAAQSIEALVLLCAEMDVESFWSD